MRWRSGPTSMGATAWFPRGGDVACVSQGWAVGREIFLVDYLWLGTRKHALLGINKKRNNPSQMSTVPASFVSVSYPTLPRLCRTTVADPSCCRAHYRGIPQIASQIQLTPPP